MSMHVGSASGDDEVVATINTTPLVDVMLVLLIIFLITIPVVTNTVPVKLPEERNIPTQTKPENVVLAVDRDGSVDWNEKLVPDNEQFLERLKQAAVLEPQPEVHIRGDEDVRYQAVGRVVVACQR